MHALQTLYTSKQRQHNLCLYFATLSSRRHSSISDIVAEMLSHNLKHLVMIEHLIGS